MNAAASVGVLYEGLRGEGSPSKVMWPLAGFSFSRAVGLRPLVSNWLLARTYPLNMGK